jgi:hypothetical protein
MALGFQPAATAFVPASFFDRVFKGPVDPPRRKIVRGEFAPRPAFRIRFICRLLHVVGHVPLV